MSVRSTFISDISTAESLYASCPIDDDDARSTYTAAISASEPVDSVCRPDAELSDDDTNASVGHSSVSYTASSTTGWRSDVFVSPSGPAADGAGTDFAQANAEPCAQCGSEKVRHGCGHFECRTLACLPLWRQELERDNWRVPGSLHRLLDKGLFDSSDRCSDCRPEAAVLRKEPPRWCRNIIRRGKCRYGAKCNFCHLQADRTIEECRE